jgi:hypothetical protein
LSTSENIKVHVSKKERLASGNEVEFGVEATVPKGDVLATFRHWRLMFQELVATPSPTTTPGPTKNPAEPQTKLVEPKPIQTETPTAGSTEPATPTPAPAPTTTPTPPTRNTDPYAGLPWNPSKDDPSFSWILLFGEKLDPQVRQLVEEIERTPSHRARHGNVAYSLSTMKSDGKRFLHRKTEPAKPRSLPEP